MHIHNNFFGHKENNMKPNYKVALLLSTKFYLL